MIGFSIAGYSQKAAVARIDSDENLILENQNVRMIFKRSKAGYTAAVISVNDGNQWRQMAVSRPIGQVAYSTASGKTIESNIIPTKYEILKSDGPLAQVRFSAERVDEDDAIWNFVYTFEIESGKQIVKTNYQAWANKDRQLLYFQGPTLYAGEGSFGTRKHQAVFPGLEYLEAHEKSSSDRDNGPKFANRYAPHPYKITIPFMAVEADKCLIGVMWDMLQKWDSEHVTTAARFASPNLDSKQNNHLMGLFLPSIPEFVPENDTRATKRLIHSRQITRSRLRPIS